MNYPPPGQHMAQNFRPNGPNRRQSDFHYPPPVAHIPPHQYQYPIYTHPVAYHVPPQMHHYQPQWYPQYAQYAPPPPRHFQPQPPMIATSHPQMLPVLPAFRQPLHTPQPVSTPQPATPSTVSQAVSSPSTTPTTTSASTSTPPVATPKPTLVAPVISSPLAPAVIQPAQPPHRMPYYPKLPWFSVPDTDFPTRAPRRRRKKTAQLSSEEVELPSFQQSQPISGEPEPIIATTPALGDVTPRESTPRQVIVDTASILPILEPSQNSARMPLDVESTRPISIDPSLESGPKPQPLQAHRRTTRPVVPAVPILPIAKHVSKPSITSPPLEVKEAASAPPDNDAIPEIQTAEEAPTLPSPLPDATTSAVRAPPKSWAELFARTQVASAPTAEPQLDSVPVVNGTILPKTGSLGEVLRAYTVSNDGKFCFLEPRGLVNTGNMCYMNSILQVLLFCSPFYEFLDQVGRRVVHNFKSDTPLVEAMIMFMREYPIIDSAVSVEQLRLRLKDSELEQYGESFIPEYVYDVIKRLPRFSTMRRGHQQDAEEFLGFLLEGLHDECTLVVRNTDLENSAFNTSDGPTLPASEASAGLNDSANGGWLEVGPKQKAAVTRSSGTVVTESPITKIFGGKLRSVLRVPGSKDSVTLEPYQPLQLDIGAPNVYNITDALKGLTRSETLHGEFNSPRGPGTTATKQVFIETLPPVLILHLKRFHYDNAGGTQKIWRKIGYPLELEIPKDVFPPNQRGALSIRPGGLPKYRLISVVYHHGKSASGGHYTVDVRRQEGREWIRIDDTVIRRIRAEDVAGEGSEEDPKLLAKALEQHKRDGEEATNGNIYKQAFGGEADPGNEDDDEGVWSQVNGNSTSPTAPPNSGKKWSAIANGTGPATPSTSTPGGQTPKASAKYSVKDNKVAYILFYQRIGA